MPGQRRDHLKRFYSLLDGLSLLIGGAKRLEECDGRVGF